MARIAIWRKIVTFVTLCCTKVLYSPVAYSKMNGAVREDIVEGLVNMA